MDHDGGYHLLFSHPEMVEDLLKTFVPETWVGQLDFGTLGMGDVITSLFGAQIWFVFVRSD